jgi:glutaredoxin
MLKIMKKGKVKIVLGLMLFGIISLFSIPKSMAAEKVNLYLFWGEGCPHCAKEKNFLAELIKEDPDIVLHEFEVYKDVEGRSKFIEATEKLNIETNGVPLLIIGDKYLVGFMNEETTGKEIKRLIEESRKNGCFDVFADENFGADTEIVNPIEKPEEEIPVEIEDPDDDALIKITPGDSDSTENISEQETCEPSEENSKIILPKIGNLNMESLSLPALTIVLGFLDGFNPCAMWVLLFLISLLIGMKDRKKMWILGIAFIVSSSFVYFLFMVAWLNFFKFVGFITWVRVLIAIIALVGAYSSVKKFFSEDSSGCDVSNSEKKEKVFKKIGNIISNKSFLLSLIGIICLAFVINLVELICSAGLPVIYTQVLSLNNMEGIKYYLYILLYIIFFMLDDLFVFFVAMITLQMTGITTKYVKYTRLIGGIILAIIGILILFRPDLLMFG